MASSSEAGTPNRCCAAAAAAAIGPGRARASAGAALAPADTISVAAATTANSPAATGDRDIDDLTQEVNGGPASAACAERTIFRRQREEEEATHLNAGQMSRIYSIKNSQEFISSGSMPLHVADSFKQRGRHLESVLRGDGRAPRPRSGVFLVSHNSSHLIFSVISTGPLTASSSDALPRTGRGCRLVSPWLAIPLAEQVLDQHEHHHLNRESGAAEMHLKPLAEDTGAQRR